MPELSNIVETWLESLSSLYLLPSVEAAVTSREYCRYIRGVVVCYSYMKSGLIFFVVRVENELVTKQNLQLWYFLPVQPADVCSEISSLL